MDTCELIRQRDLLDRLGISRSTLWVWRSQNAFPEPVRIGGAAFYDTRAVAAWIKKLTDRNGRGAEAEPYIGIVGGHGRLFNRSSLARLLGVTPKALRRWQERRGFPPGLVMGRQRVWRLDEIEGWAEAFAPELLDRIRGQDRGATMDGTAMENSTDNLLDDGLMTPQEVAELLAVSEERLATWRRNRVGPSWVSLGREPRYPRRAIEAFIRQRLIKTNT